MPYASVKSLPAATKDLTPHQRKIFRAAFNASYAQYKGDEQKAFATAWSAVNKSKAKDAWSEEARMASAETRAANKKNAASRPIKGGMQGHYLAGLKEAWAGRERRQFATGYDTMHMSSYHHGFDVGSQSQTKQKDASPPQEITLTIPLLIRLMEFGREDAKDDLDIHNMAERIAQSAGKKDCLESGDYEKLTADGWSDILNDVGWTEEARQAAAQARQAHTAQPNKLYPHADLSSTRLKAAWEKQQKENSQLGSEMIAAGRGMEKPSETRTKNDELAVRVNAAANRHETLRTEMRRRERFSGSLKPIPVQHRQSFSSDARSVPWSKFMDEFRIAHGDAGYSPDQLRHHKSGRWTGGVFKPQEISRSQVERKKKRSARDQGLVSTGWSSLNPTSPAEKSMPPISPAESARQELARPTLGSGRDRQKRKIPPASRDDDRQKRNIKPVTDPTSEYPSPSGAEHVQYLETRRKRRAKDSKPWWQKFTNSNGDNQ